MADESPEQTDDVVLAHIDGACLGNPGPGGWAVILRWRGQEKSFAGGARDTTNNRMELQAAIEALTALKRPAHVRVHTDSRYVRDGISTWIHGWKRNGWLTADRKPVKNADLWRQLDALLAQHRIEWLWVKGHSGDPDNDRVDALARAAARGLTAVPVTVPR